MTRLGLVLAASLCAAADFPAPEELRYSINWPSGLPLGEAHIIAKGGTAEGAARWNFEFGLEAAVPGYKVAGQYRSASSAQLCSVQFEKDATLGKRRIRERTVFEADRSLAVRQTLPDGGKSELPVEACARDALSFLYYVRRELSQGRIPPAQTVYFGAPYRIRLEYSGTQTIRVGDERIAADRLVASIKGPASQIAVEMFFARDAVRTPLVVKVPLALGAFTLELVR